MTQANDRLDRIERILEQTVVLSQATASRLDVVATQQQTNTAAIAQLTQKLDGLTTEVDALRDIVMHAIGNAEVDRETFQAEAIASRAEFQAEIRRIWEYLLRQSGNGRGGNDQPNS